ncbi:hypothetical protein CERSUDRAFT_98910 [Gelatoporia subvermispora B]|uniref:Uncharacterized protein n=1 Tax=Ceriporiopsis subvermispora (strain B) TaxID=914234 RepID=M2R3X9_CERS8|nr:hypothetical protein CERSUDRAFT_98910 [Gelatoporia subvermispora B]
MSQKAEQAADIKEEVLPSEEYALTALCFTLTGIEFAKQIEDVSIRQGELHKKGRLAEAKRRFTWARSSPPSIGLNAYDTKPVDLARALPSNLNKAEIEVMAIIRAYFQGTWYPPLSALNHTQCSRAHSRA